MKVLGFFFLTAQGYPLVTPGNVPFFESRAMKDHNLLSLTPVLDYLSLSKDAEIDWTTSIQGRACSCIILECCL